jgi:hypothetical protein
MSPKNTALNCNLCTLLSFNHVFPDFSYVTTTGGITITFRWLLISFAEIRISLVTRRSLPRLITTASLQHLGACETCH